MPEKEATWNFIWLEGSIISDYKVAFLYKGPEKLANLHVTAVFKLSAY